MAVLRWDPWGELAALQRDVNELFSRTAAPARTAAGAGAAALVPPIDAYRTDEALVVTVDLPGMGPDAVDVSVNDGMLTVSGERPVTGDVADDQWLRRERPRGRFERSFTLPEGTNPADIAATFTHGVLELRIPHPPERKPHRIQVGTGDSQERETVNVG